MTIAPSFSVLQKTINSLDISSIPEPRKAVLDPLVYYIREKIAKNEAIALNFICTHNSRRSHLSQVWAQALAHYTGVKNISCYSGGTEATALFPLIAETLEDSGFQIDCISKGKNPVYAIKYASNAHPTIGFSKKFDADFNPKSNFAAIMTCSSADKGCPLVTGSDGRFSMTYEDPKAFDSTPLQKEKYGERSLEIATELWYVMQKSTA